MKEASFYTHLEKDSVQCILCPHNCHINPGKRGSCHVRKNIGGKLFSENYGMVSAIHFDPIEKKPMYHFFPGRTIYSIGSLGCNLHCSFCQNSEISQSCIEEFSQIKDYSAIDHIRMAASNPDNIGIAYTYNEPIVWYEYMNEIALLAKEKQLKNVMVTNGFINVNPLQEIMPVIDAYSVDLKAFTNDFYRKITASRLEPVRNALKSIAMAGKHLEITNLIIPTLNDDEKVFGEMCKWIRNELGADTILHLSRYYPTYKMTIEGTPFATLQKLYAVAMRYLDYVYLGNVASTTGRDTACNRCGNPVIRRDGYWTSVSGLDKTGHCVKCGNKVAIME
ncbi:MAG: AmmeMemoRadiSam system radical SAM enzyme [Bacteroidetes bacterium]|nr:AmmeMemoRadiSam system radical SAM enzyme [Bacteroidota bacterium]